VATNKSKGSETATLERKTAVLGVRGKVKKKLAVHKNKENNQGKSVPGGKGYMSIGWRGPQRGLWKQPNPNHLGEKKPGANGPRRHASGM